MTFAPIRSSPWLRRALWGFAGLLLVWVMAWALLPVLIKSQLTRLANEQLGRQISIGQVSLQPWSLELTLNDLQLMDAQGASPQLKIARIYMDVELQSLLRWAPVIDALQVDGLALRLTHLGTGRYDIDDLLSRWLTRADDSKSSPGLPRFALYNLALRAASVDFVDQNLGRTHELRELALSIPFLSNLEAQRHVMTEPRLAFQFNGSHFDSSAQSTPFALTRNTDAVFRLVDLDLRPYVPYLPVGLPVKLLAGVVQGDVRLHFEQTPKPVLRLGGHIAVQGLAMADRAGQDLLKLETGQIEMADVRPLERVAQLAALTLTGLQLDLRRDQAGQINLLNLTAASPALNPISHTNSKGSELRTGHDWQLAVARLSVDKGKVRWRDAAVQPEARWTLHELMLNVRDLAWPMRQPTAFDGAVWLAEGADNEVAATRTSALVKTAARLNFQGQASSQEATGQAELRDLSLAMLAPYSRQHMSLRPAGRLSTEVAWQWRDKQWQLRIPSLVASQLRLAVPAHSAGDDTGVPLALDHLEIQNAEIRPAEHLVSLGRFFIRQPVVAVERDKAGHWIFERWLPGAAAVGTSAAGAKPTRPAQPSVPWRVAVADAALEGGRVRYADQAAGRNVAFDVANLALRAKNFSSDGDRPQAVTLSAQLRSRRGEAGRLSFQGGLALRPLAVRGQLQASDLPLHVLAPYVRDVLNISLVRAHAGFKGQLHYAQTSTGMALDLGGDALLEDFAANTVPLAGQVQDLFVTEELLSWKTLSLHGIELAARPGQATQVAVAETAVTDFFARVLINEAGRINLQDIVKPSGGDKSGDTAAAPDGMQARHAPMIAMGPVSLLNGRVEFSDRFIKPSYSARLSEVTGRLGAFSSQGRDTAPAMADLELRGRAEGTASIDIQGRLNPLAEPLVLDITGKLRDLELPPLSPYSIKYAGHGIERGKLSMDINYQVQPDGQLIATNKLVLNQLTFGAPVEGAPNSLPVRLAVALLADGKGMIDLNLPISGSLNEPDFRLGPIIAKMVLNLIGKAITAPFALLASVLGSGDEQMDRVAFAPGVSALDATAQSSLDKIAQAMKERPGLILTVAGSANLDAERAGYKRARLDALLLAEKQRVAVATKQPSESVSRLTVEERPALLRQVYRRAQIVKPRNLLGLVKDLPPAEMEALLLASIPATQEQMRELALARGVAVRDYLNTRQLPLERLFLGAAKTDAGDARWVPHAELSLTTD